MQQIVFAANALQDSFCMSAATVNFSPSGHNSNTFARIVTRALQDYPVVIVPSVMHEQAGPDVVCDARQVLLSLGNLSQNQIAKAIIISNGDGIFDQFGNLLSEVNSAQIKDLLNRNVISGELVTVAETALYAVDKLGIQRVHVVNGTKSDDLLLEVFTKDGSGTMIYSGGYIEVRQARNSDLPGMHHLSHCLNIDAEEHCFPNNVGEFWVGAIDEHIVAYARLQLFSDEKKSLISSLAINQCYPEIGLKLLTEMAKVYACGQSQFVFVAVPMPVPWWIPRDFKESSRLFLPKSVQKDYADKLKSVGILSKTLDQV